MIIPISVLSVFSRATKASIAPFESMTFTPLYQAGNNSSVIVKGNGTSFKFTLYIENDRYTAMPILEKTVIGNGSNVYNFNNSYTRPRNQIYLAITSANKTTYTEKIEMNLSSSSYKNINSSPEFTSNNSLAILDSNLNWERKKVNYTFNNFNDYYVPDYYHKFDFSDFNIVIPDDQQSLFSCTAKFVINYKNGVFDDLSGANNGYVELPLKHTLSDSKYFFSLQKNIYVHPSTLAVSSTKLTGYVETKHIYFPRNSMQNQGDYYCYFIFQNFGIDKDYAIHSFHIKAFKNIVGDCHNSKYCVQKLYK